MIPIGFLAASGAGLPPSNFVLLQTQVLSGEQSELTFSGLAVHASNYRHLQIRLVARTNRNDTSEPLIIRLNGDSGSNYAWHQLSGQGSSVASTAGTSQTRMEFDSLTGNLASTDAFGSMVIDILDAFNSSKNTTVRAFYGRNGGSNQIVGLGSGAWFNTASLTQISLFPRFLTSNAFVANSRFSLYGVK